MNVLVLIFIYSTIAKEKTKKCNVTVTIAKKSNILSLSLGGLIKESDNER
tara:strand:+ start:488 stop:637 length:150 start_codon:yes stop_codon:yes gene_type:complete